jgi:hypothetical protein
MNIGNRDPIAGFLERHLGLLPFSTKKEQGLGASGALRVPDTAAGESD